MNDLNTITRLNAEAFAASIQNYRRQGRWVLAKYAGLHLESIETFLVQSDAQTAFDTEAAKRDASGRAVLFTPIPDVQGLTQADYARPADVTLGDDINRKNRSL